MSEIKKEREREREREIEKCIFHLQVVESLFDEVDKKKKGILGISEIAQLNLKLFFMCPRFGTDGISLPFFSALLAFKEKNQAQDFCSKRNYKPFQTNCENCWGWG